MASQEKALENLKLTLDMREMQEKNKSSVQFSFPKAKRLKTPKAK